MNTPFLFFLVILIFPFSNWHKLHSSDKSTSITSQGRSSFVQEIPYDLIEGYRSKVDSPTPKLMDDLYGEESGIPGFTYFLKTVAQNPILRNEMLLSFKLNNEVFYPNFYRTPQEKTERLRYLPFVYGPRIRSHFLNFTTTSLQINSENTHKNLPKKSHWDIVVIGAGFHGSLLANRIKAQKPDADIVIIDKESLPSQHFYKGGTFFRMNNTLNENDEGPSFQRTEKYNIPHTCGPIQVTDMTGHRWPTAKLMAEVGRITLLSSKVSCLLNTEIISISKSENHYLLKTTAGNTFSANMIVFATGLGKPNIPCSDKESKKILENALGKKDISAEDKIMTVEQAFSITSKIEPSTIWKSKENKENLDVILVGFGNSAVTFLEFLYSIGPDSCYQFESIQSKSVIKTAVITGSSITNTTVAEISKKLRPRYSGILSPIKEGQIKLFAGMMTKVKYRENGTIEVFYTSPNGTEESLIGNRLILGTGYQRQIDALLNAGGFNIKKEDFITLKASVLDSSIPIPIAKKLVNEKIYVVGPAAGRDLVDVNHNTNGNVPFAEIAQAEAIPYTSILTETFATNLANTLTIVSNENNLSEAMIIIDGDPLHETSHFAPLINVQAKSALTKNFISESINEEITTELKTQLIQILSRIHFKNMKEIELKIFWEQDQLLIFGEHLKKTDIEWLATEIKKNHLILNLLVGYISSIDTLTFSIKIDPEKKQSKQLIPESSDLTLVTRHYNVVYVNTSNSLKQDELMDLFEKHKVKLFSAPKYSVIGLDAKFEKVIAKINSVDEGVIIEDNILEINRVTGSKEIQDDLSQLESFIGENVTWTCYLCQKRGSEIYVYRGIAIGMLVPKSGTLGFGFDSYFKPVGSTKTLGEEKLDKNNARAQAVEAFIKNQVYHKVSILNH